MTALGVFRDDFYNAVSALAQTQYVATAAGTSTIPASSIAGAGDCYLVASGQAGVTFTTDSAINIISQIQNAVATAYKQGLGSFAAGVNPPNGVPNLFNTTWTLTINNQNTGSITLAGGTGVTLLGTNAVTIVTVTSRVYVVTITSPTTVTMQSEGSFLSGAP
jgi:non-ribosomal peptide synthetase component F